MSFPSNEEPLCSAAGGRCPFPQRKQGLCWGHYQRRKRRQALSTPLGRRTATPLEGLYQAMLDFKDELDTLDDDEFERGKERVRFALRRYLYQYVPALLRKAKFTAAARAEVNAWLETYGDKSAHGVSRARSKQSNPQQRKATP